MKEIWEKNKKAVLGVITAAILALVAIFNQAVNDYLTSTVSVDTPVAGESVIVVPTEEVPAGAEVVAPVVE